MATLNKEVWVNQIKENFYPETSFVAWLFAPLVDKLTKKPSSSTRIWFACIFWAC